MEEKDKKIKDIPRKREKKLIKKRHRCVEFEEAREIVRKECIGSANQYLEWWMLNTPARLPKRPHRAYKFEWNGWNDFLGNNNVFLGGVTKKYRSFEDARAFVRKLGLKNRDEWTAYRKTGKCPDDIPGRPDLVYYKKKKWTSWRDFLGAHVIDRIYEMNEGVVVVLYIAHYPDSPTNVFKFGTVSSVESLNNLINVEGFTVVRAFRTISNLPWKEMIAPYVNVYADSFHGELIVNNPRAIFEEFVNHPKVKLIDLNDP